MFSLIARYILELLVPAPLPHAPVVMATCGALSAPGRPHPPCFNLKTFLMAA